MNGADRHGPDTLPWDDTLLVGDNAMDDTHREFVTLVDALLNCAPHDALPRLQAFAAHARRHFGDEELRMRSTAFPSMQCHADEHAQVLQSVQQVLVLLADGQADAALVRNLAQHLAHWLPGHTAYMDSALASWISKQAHGGVPVVLRRAATQAVDRA